MGSKYRSSYLTSVFAVATDEIQDTRIDVVALGAQQSEGESLGSEASWTCRGCPRDSPARVSDWQHERTVVGR